VLEPYVKGAVSSFAEWQSPIGFARLLAQEIGGFQPPKGYDDPRLSTIRMSNGPSSARIEGRD
jgi:hypothetical protein